MAECGKRADSLAIVTTLEGCHSMAPEWEQLAAISPTGSVFSTWGWVKAWWGYYGHGGEPFVVTLRNSDRRLVGLAPLMRVRLGPLRVLKFIGAPHSDYNDLLVDPRFEREALDIIFEYLAARHDAWDLWIATEIPSTSASLTALGRVGDNGLQATTLRRVECRGRTLAGDWAAFLDSLSVRRRRKVARTMRRAEEKGVLYGLVSDPDDVPRVVAELYSGHVARWQAASRLDPVHASPTFLAFLQAVAREFLSRGHLKLERLEIGESPVALAMNFTRQL